MKVNKLKTKIVLAFSVIFGTLQAQDIHFSAMDYSPLTVNPGLAGANHKMQAIANYRTQWNAVASPYQTIAASYDMRFGETDANSKGFLAGGINFFNDDAGDNRLESNDIGLSVAYHLMLDSEHRLSLGLQGGFGQRSIVNEGTWGNQYTGGFFDPNAATGENFENASFSYFDVGSGMVYSFTPKQNTKNNNGTRLNIGVAGYHLNRPNYSFINEENDDLYVRWSGFAMAEIGLGDKKMAIEPQLITQIQGPSIETLIGSDYRFFLGDGSSSDGVYDGISLAAGLFYRNQDALLSRFSVRFQGFDAGMVYDFNVFSSLQAVSRGRGAAEIFLRYIFNGSGNKSRVRIR